MEKKVIQTHTLYYLLAIPFKTLGTVQEQFACRRELGVDLPGEEGGGATALASHL